MFLLKKCRVQALSEANHHIKLPHKTKSLKTQWLKKIVQRFYRHLVHWQRRSLRPHQNAT